MWKSKADATVKPYVKRLDNKLEDMLNEFDNFDYTYKPLLTQTEFEDQYLFVFEKLFSKKEKYDYMCTIFDSMIKRETEDAFKVLCLIDFMINLSRYDPNSFKNLPNDVVQSVYDTPVFQKIREYVYNKGRMNYNFKDFSDKTNSAKDASTNRSRNKKSSGDDDDSYDTSSSVSDEEEESEKADTKDGSNVSKFMNVSLAELTKKILKKTSLPKFLDKEDATRVKEEAQSDIDSLVDESGESEELSEDEYATRSARLTRMNLSKRSKLESLVETDEEYEEEAGASHASDDPEKDEYYDSEMNSTTSIMEHMIEFQTGDGGKQSGKRAYPFVQQVINKKKSKSNHSSEASRAHPKRSNSGARSKNLELLLPPKPRIRKVPLYLDSNLDYLYDELERYLPELNAALLQKEVKGFTYKPAQYSLFSKLPEAISGVDAEIGEAADTLLNSFIFQASKRVNGSVLDPTKFVHPFEYEHIMLNLKEYSEKGTLLPPIILTERLNSFCDPDGTIRDHMKLLATPRVKLKGLKKLQVFKDEEEYFSLFKKIVPRDKVKERIDFLNGLVTDGKSIFVFDMINSILQDKKDIPSFMNDTDDEYNELLEHWKKQVEQIKGEHHKSHPREKMDDDEAKAMKQGERADEKGDALAKKQNDEDNPEAQHKLVPEGRGEEATKGEDEPVEKESADQKAKPIVDIQSAQTETIKEDVNADGKYLKPDGLDVSKESATEINGANSLDAAETSISEKQVSEEAALTKENPSDEEEKQSHEEPANGPQANDREGEIENKEKEAEVKLKLDLNKRKMSSPKGIIIPTTTIKKVLSTKETFEKLAVLMFPNKNIDSGYKGIPFQSLKHLSNAYDGFRPYLMSIFISNVFEFLKLPRFFKIDSVLFELQIRDIVEDSRPEKKMSSLSFHK